MVRVMRIQFAWGAQLLRNSCYILFCVRNVGATLWINVRSLLFCRMIMVRVLRTQLSWGAQVMRNSGCTLLRMRSGDAFPPPPRVSVRTLQFSRMEMMRAMRTWQAWGAQVLRCSCYTLLIVRSGDDSHGPMCAPIDFAAWRRCV